MKRFFTAVLLTGALGASALNPTPASACMNSMERFEEDPQVALVDRMWSSIESKQYDNAIEVLTTEWENFVPGKFDAEKASKQTVIERRALRAIAVAHVRANNTESLDWAGDVLKSLSKAGKGADGVSAHYAEALIAAGNATDGRALLEEIAKRNGISDAFGWRLLSDLRKADGDQAGAEQALVRATTLETKAKAQPRRSTNAKRKRSKSKSKKSRSKSKQLDHHELYN